MAIFDPKAKTIAGYQRMIEEKKRTIVKYYDQIGRLYYGQYKDMSVDVTKDINTRCEAVSQLEKEIKECEHKILYEKGLKLCPNCGKENMLAYAFCFACGTKFAIDEPVAEETSDVVTEVIASEDEEVAETEDAIEEVEQESETEVIVDDSAEEVQIDEDKTETIEAN